VASLQQSSLGVLQPVAGGDPIPLLKTRLVLGRRESCDICLRFSNVSSKHCELEQVHGTWIVRDLGSTNGIRVNGERVMEKRLYPNDELEIAKQRFRIEYIPANLRSVDAEVDELHEGLMRLSLLERAGLVSRRPEAPAAKGAKGSKKPVQPNEREASLDFIRTLKGGKSEPASTEPKEPEPLRVESPALAEEGDVASMRPGAAEVGEDEFLDLVRDDEPPKDGRKKS
jgi:pSer/pThr/pTyr-binding forkhead associated (FHA) protein